MERCSVSLPLSCAQIRLAVLCLLVAAATRPVSCDQSLGGTKGGRESGRGGETPPPLLSVTAQATPTPPWAVLWGPTYETEEDPGHVLGPQDPHRHPGVAADGIEEAAEVQTSQHRHRMTGIPATTESQLLLEEREKERKSEGKSEEEEVDPQFYVTVTISSLLILTAAIITAKLCYDRSCSRHTPPLSRGGAPSLSLSLPRSLSPEDSRQTLTCGAGLPRTPSFDRDRIPVVNL
ncbi:PILR alpha-associated neural protein [Lepisosteus oculatus]|uniref:PILR alpha-associated neural protein n=1 Tax=Lepisosteus oculatus TaxID=7918 RepID=UPI0037245DB8